jgi:Na+/H+-dicarboxylate symporter
MCMNILLIVHIIIATSALLISFGRLFSSFSSKIHISSIIVTYVSGIALLFTMNNIGRVCTSAAVFTIVIAVLEILNLSVFAKKSKQFYN